MDSQRITLPGKSRPLFDGRGGLRGTIAYLNRWGPDSPYRMARVTATVNRPRLYIALMREARRERLRYPNA